MGIKHAKGIHAHQKGCTLWTGAIPIVGFIDPFIFLTPVPQTIAMHVNEGILQVAPL
jgi:hypothetical protein